MKPAPPPPTAFQPQNDSDIADFLRAQSATAAPVCVQGGGSKAAFGAPIGDNTARLDISGLSGIVLYQPDELVLTAQAGTTLDEIAAAVSQRGQCLGFEPPEFGALFGMGERRSTLGGAAASGWSGPRRIKAGAVRDHVLGARAIGGDGQVFQSGGRVVKNVTGFDLPKLLTGSHGTLAVMTEITIKVLPSAQISRTLVIGGLDDAAAIRLLSDALGGPYDIAGAAHLPPAAAARSGVAMIARSGVSATLLRVEGFGPSVSDRFSGLAARFGAGHNQIVLAPDEETILWTQCRDIAPLIDPDAILWRLSLPASEAAATVAAIKNWVPVEAVYDWGGGLVWLTAPDADDAHAAAIRRALPSGHATLMRAPINVRANADIFQQQPPALAALTRRVKAAFDPSGILSPGYRQRG
jgi:glycolate oxidase FAD binding subunit